MTLQRSLCLNFCLCFAIASLAGAAAKASAEAFPIEDSQRIALVGNSTAERMNLYGHLETLLQLRFHDQRPVFRNFGWPADEVANQQRPGNYTLIDDPFKVYGPDLLICFFGFNESYSYEGDESLEKFTNDYRAYIAKQTEQFALDGRKPRFVLVTPIAFESTGNPLQPSGAAENERLSRYAEAVRQLGQADGHRVVDLFEVTREAFSQRARRAVHDQRRSSQRTGGRIDQSRDRPTTLRGRAVVQC